MMLNNIGNWTKESEKWLVPSLWKSNNYSRGKGFIHLKTKDWKN